MDEQRTEAYVKLIHEILDCPSGEEVEVLNAHPELLDAGLLEVTEQVVEDLKQQGDKNRANFLSDFAHRLRETLGITYSATSSEEEIKVRLDFLMEILHAISESNGDLEVVYPLLGAKQNLLDVTFGSILWRWTEIKLAKLEAGQAQSLAVLISVFSDLIQQFPLAGV